MQKVSIKKLSILGLVLMGASAVTAAIMPNKTDKKDVNFAAGSLTNHSSLNNAGLASSLTCAPDSDGQIQDGACNASTNDPAGSATTISGGANTSDGNPSGNNGATTTAG